VSMQAIFVGVVLAAVTPPASAQNLTLRDLSPFRAPTSLQSFQPLVEAHFDRRNAVYADGEVLGLRVRTAINDYLTVYSIGPVGDFNRILPNRFNGDNSVRATQEVKIPGPGALALVSSPLGDERIQIDPVSGHPGGSSTIVQTGFHSLPASTSLASRPQFVLEPALIRTPSNLAVISKKVGGSPLPRV